MNPVPASSDPALVAEMAREALIAQREAEVLPTLYEAVARAPGRARLWHWIALLQRALGAYTEAGDAIARASHLAPADPLIAHVRARIALESGVDAVSLFIAARRQAPDDAMVALGLSAAHLAAGDAASAVRDLTSLLAERPQWIAGHQQLAQMQWTLGERGLFAASFEQALTLVPGDEELWGAYLVALIHAKAYDRAADAVARAGRNLPRSRTVAANEAVLRSETGEKDRADALFAALAPISEPTVAVQQVRHLLRNGRAEAATPIIHHWLETPHATGMWPYASIVWRLTGDARYRWLEGQAGLVGVYDLRRRLPPLGELAETLRRLHRAKHQQLDQSVRGGTQTEGMLFADMHPHLRAVRDAASAAVAEHVRRLPPHDPHHPTLAARRDRTPRFAGSWSVRLSGEGHHANHIHPAGWLSSALYVALPEDMTESDAQAGWLTLGAPDSDLGLTLPPVRTVAPRPGRLVLFPSTMWHGTRPFAQGERLTIAFDVAHPAP